MSEPVPRVAAALLALWNDVDPARAAEYEDWHAREHVPERLTVPGMLWGLRYAQPAGAAAGMPRYLTLYGLATAQVLQSEPYLRLLREPTPASAALRPALQHVSRWVCSVSACKGDLRAERLAVWALPGPPGADEMAALTHGASTWLCGQRIEAAAPLPWLAAGQAGGVAGQALVCAAPGITPLPAGARLFVRLPVG